MVRVVVPVVAAVVIMAVVVLHHILIRRPLPVVGGTVDVDGIDAPLRITRDRAGIPHIAAGSVDDAAFACGVVHAQDRGWQLDLLRRVVMGRVAEIAGQEALEADRLVRRLGLWRTAVAEEALLDGEERRLLEAYAHGVNTVLCTGMQARPVELVLLRQRFTPWRPAHSLAVGKLVALGLACDWDFEVQRLRLLAAGGAEAAAAAEVPYPAANPTVLAATVGAVPAAALDDLAARYRALAAWLPAGAQRAASNAWAVAGTRTATGRPLVCSDPHLPPSVPSVWYALHIDVEGDLAVAGLSTPGAPLVAIGHNRRVAWGVTNSFADVQDLVVEELEGPLGERVRTEAGMLPTAAREERIRVRGGNDVVERVVVTRHGPLVERFRGADGVDRGLALQWRVLEPSTAAPRGLLAMARAGSCAELRDAAVAAFPVPLNVVSADDAGHIAYLLAGAVPVRPGAASRLPLAGWEADRRFVRDLTPDELPQLEDPEGGVVVTANHRIVGDGFPHHIGFDTMNGYRALRIGRLLEGRERIDAQLSRRVQMDIVSPPARVVARLLGGVRCSGRLAEEARAALAAWDGVMAPGATEPAVYEAFVRELARVVMEPSLGPAWALAFGEMPHAVFGHAGNLTGRLLPSLLAEWEAGDARRLGGRRWDAVAATAMEGAVEGLRRRHGRPGRWRWGRLHALPLEHVLGRRRPLGLLFNLGSVEVGGGTDTVLQTAYEPGLPYRARGWAPCARLVMEVGAWDDATVVLLPGQSGHPGSRHYRDLVADWSRNRQHPLAWSEAAIAGVRRSSLLLRPRPRAAAQPSAQEDRGVAESRAA